MLTICTNLLAKVGLLTTILFCLFACEKSQTSTESKVRSQFLKPISDEFIEAICSLKQRKILEQLQNSFGSPTKTHKWITGKIGELSWRKNDIGIDALIGSDGRFEFVFAGQKQTSMRLKGPIPERFSHLSDKGVPRQEFDTILGSGVLTRVVWIRGLDVPQQAANRYGVEPRLLEDHCDLIYTWIVPGLAKPLSIAFDDHDKSTPNAFAQLSSL